MENKLAVIDGETLMDMRLPPMRFCSSTLLPKEMAALIVFMRVAGSFTGSNAELIKNLNTNAGTDISAKGLKQMMNKWRYPLENAGVHFRSYRSNGQRLVDISFSAVPSDSSDGNDANTGCAKSFVTCDPCVPDITFTQIEAQHSGFDLERRSKRANEERPPSQGVSS